LSGTSTDVGIYGRAISASEFQAIYNAGGTSKLSLPSWGSMPAPQRRGAPTGQLPRQAEHLKQIQQEFPSFLVA
jgi:hypothetical protein